ncbi:hypothetical protein ACFYU9_35465 [Streptomyces sp. NPDC004327]|uniref:DUF4760 domain-containing protein n=1 Tax=Streptomyces sp. NPDC004327 TaxID=3364699 RepID=UPI0036C872BE
MSAWDVTTALSSAFSAVVVTAACGYAAAQVKEARRARSFQSLVTLHKEYHAPELRKFRRRIRNGEVSDLEALVREDRESLEDLLQKLELVAILVSRGLVRRQDAIDLFPSIPAVISKLRPYIDSRRTTQPTYALNALALASSYP